MAANAISNNGANHQDVSAANSSNAKRAANPVTSNVANHSNQAIGLKLQSRMKPGQTDPSKWLMAASLTVNVHSAAHPTSVRATTTNANVVTAPIASRLLQPLQKLTAIFRT